MRRLRALARLDPGVATVIAARDQRRRQTITVLVERLGADPSTPSDETEGARLVALLYTLTSFETFDTLAGDDATILDVAPQIEALTAAALADTSTRRRTHHPRQR